MTVGKWDNNGDLNFGDGENDSAATMNTTLQEVFCPIGSVIGWAKSITGVPQTLPQGWVECNGQVLSDANSPYNGETIPDLNGDNRYLRGNDTSGGTGGSEDHTHTIATDDHIWASGVYSNGNINGNNVTYTDVSNDPPYYQVVWIMRIK